MKRTRRAIDTGRAAYLLLKLHCLFRVRGQRWVARTTRAGMKVSATPQAELDATGVDAWHTARAVWRAKRWLPLHSTCLQTALATQMLFHAKGAAATVVVGVRSAQSEAHAWVEIGDFVLDDQRLNAGFAAFQAPGMPAEGTRP